MFKGHGLHRFPLPFPSLCLHDAASSAPKSVLSPDCRFLISVSPLAISPRVEHDVSPSRRPSAERARAGLKSTAVSGRSGSRGTWRTFLFSSFFSSFRRPFSYLLSSRTSLLLLLSISLFFFFFSPDHFSSPLFFFLPFFENPSRRHFLRRDISFLGKPRSEGGFQGILRRRLPWGLGRASWEREGRRSPRRGVPAGVQEVHLAIRRTERGGSGREPRMSLHKGRSYVTAGEWLLGQ